MVLLHKLTLQILDPQPYFRELVKAHKLSKVRTGQYLDENLQGKKKKKKKSIYSGGPAVFVS